MDVSPPREEADQLLFKQAVKKIKSAEGLDFVKDNWSKLKDFKPSKKPEEPTKFQYRYRDADEDEWSLLHYALAYDDVETAEFLIQAIDVDGLFFERKSKKEVFLQPLEIASYFARYETVEKCLAALRNEYGADKVKELIMKRTINQWCPFYYAIECNRANVVKLYLENGADVTLKDKVFKRNAVHFCAVVSVRESLQEIFRSAGDQVQGILNEGDAYGKTPLHIACKENNASIVELLLTEGANTNAKCKSEETPFSVSLKFKSEESTILLLEHQELTLEYNEDHFRRALKFDSPRITLSLLKKLHQCHVQPPVIKADFLHHVVRSESYSDYDFTEVIKLLGKMCIEFKDEKQQTPVMVAAMLNKHRKLKILISTYKWILGKNFFYNVEGTWKDKFYEEILLDKDIEGNYAVHLAIMCNGMDTDFEKTVAVLEDARKEVDKDSLQTLQNGEHKTPIQLALEGEKFERALMLLKASEGKQLHFPNSSTIIHCAIENKMSRADFREMLKMILEFNINHSTLFNQKNRQGNTALHLALNFQLQSHVESLLALEDIISPDIETEDEKNALQLAIERGFHLDLIRKILDHRTCDYTKINVDAVDVSQAKEILQRSEGNQLHHTNFLKEAILKNKIEIVEFILQKGNVEIDWEVMKIAIMDQEKKDFARLLVRQYHDCNHIMMLLKEGNACLFHELIKRMDDVAEEALDRSAADSGCHVDLLEDSKPRFLLAIFIIGVTVFSAGEPTDVAVESNGIPLQSLDAAAGNDEETITTNPLEIMVEYKREKLLQHHSVREFLDSEWKAYGLPLYIGQLIAYLFLIVPLTILLVPTSQIVLCGFNGEENQCFYGVTYGLAGWIMLVTLLHVVVGVVVIVITGKLSKKKDWWKYIFYPIKENLHRYFQIAVFSLSFLFSLFAILHTSTGCCESAHWHFGLFAIVFGWTYLISLFNKFPFVGEHSIVFFTIAWTFLKLAVFGLLLVLGSVIVLMTLFFDENAPESPFVGFGRGIVTVVTMVSGEIDYQDVFGFSYDLSNSSSVVGTERNIRYYHTALFVWVVFVVLIPILLSNMLTGLAVGDTLDLQDSAELRKFTAKVKLVCYAKKLGLKFPTCSCKWLIILWRGTEEETEYEGTLKSYKEKLDAEKEQLKLKYSSETARDDTRLVENIESVKEVALTCERKIKEFKAVFDDSTQKLEMKILKLEERLRKTN